MPPRKKAAKPELTLVKAVSEMIQMHFRQHCLQRHASLGFYHKNEHEQDHRLHQESLDHIHSNMIEREEAAEDATTG